MIEIRKLKRVKDYKKTFEIQKSAWGINDLEIDPHFLMTRVQKYGGLLQGLFLDEICVGFSYGIMGKWQGEIFFFSYSVAVLKEHQGKGFGFLLKKAQRQEVMEMGYDVIRWNYDPLESLNAYFNIHRLGTNSEEYERDIYGEGENGLQKGLPTDRLVATWDLKSKRVIERMKTKIPRISFDVPKDKIENYGEKIAFIEIPRDIRLLKESNMNQAYHWRMKTRESFESAFKKGFIVEEYVFSKDQTRVFYKLRKKDK